MIAKLRLIKTGRKLKRYPKNFTKKVKQILSEIEKGRTQTEIVDELQVNKQKVNQITCE